MNQSLIQTQPKDQINSNAAVLHAGTTQKPGSVVPPLNMASRQRKAVNEYTPDSLWSHLGYGLGMLAVIVIPLYIPGVSVRGLIIGYMVAVPVIYTVIFLLGITGSLHLAKKSKKGRYRKQYRQQ